MTGKLLVSVDPQSADLFAREVKESRLAKALGRLDEHRHLCQVEDGFDALFWLHRFPVQAQWQPGAGDLTSILEQPWYELDGEWLGERSYGIQVSSNVRWDWSFADLVGSLREQLGLPEERFRPRQPERVLSIYLHRRGDTTTIYAGVSSTAENLSPWASGQCRIPRDDDTVSRAEAKLLEAYEAFLLPAVAVGEQPRALDLGAAPGGWSRVLAGQGYHVDAVDPAPLDPRLSSARRITYHPETAGRFFGQHRPGVYSLLVSDMKMDASMAASLLVRHASCLKPEGGRLLSTLKLGKGPVALDQAREALQRLGERYQVLAARQLYFNRSEITVLARPLDKGERSGKKG